MSDDLQNMKNSRDYYKREYKRLCEDNKFMQREIKLLTADKIKFERMKSESTNGILITDHALIRYMERVEGFNIYTIRDRLSKKVNNLLDGKEYGKFNVDGNIYVIKNKRLVTIY